MPKSVTVLPGEKYGSWTVVHEVAPAQRGIKLVRRIKVRCSCGIEATVELFPLRYGKTTRCVECGRSGVRTHGLSKSAEYKIWKKMLEPCYNKNADYYKFYGGAGVTVCDRWNPQKGGSFENFLADVGKRPSPLHQLDKEAVLRENKIYAPGLVKWVTKRQNLQNKKNTIEVALSSGSFTIMELSKFTGIPYETLRQRISKMKMRPETAIAMGYRPQARH